MGRRGPIGMPARPDSGTLIMQGTQLIIQQWFHHCHLAQRRGMHAPGFPWLSFLLESIWACPSGHAWRGRSLSTSQMQQLSAIGVCSAALSRSVQS